MKKSKNQCLLVAVSFLLPSCATRTNNAQIKETLKFKNDKAVIAADVPILENKKNKTRILLVGTRHLAPASFYQNSFEFVSNYVAENPNTHIARELLVLDGNIWVVDEKKNVPRENSLTQFGKQAVGSLEDMEPAVKKLFDDLVDEGVLISSSDSSNKQGDFNFPREVNSSNRKTSGQTDLKVEGSQENTFDAYKNKLKQKPRTSILHEADLFAPLIGSLQQERLSALAAVNQPIQADLRYSNLEHYEQLLLAAVLCLARSQCVQSEIGPWFLNRVYDETDLRKLIDELIMKKRNETVVAAVAAAFENEELWKSLDRVESVQKLRGKREWKNIVLTFGESHLPGIHNLFQKEHGYRQARKMHFEKLTCEEYQQFAKGPFRDQLLLSSNFDERKADLQCPFLDKALPMYKKKHQLKP